jgi:recombination protein RecA
MDFIKEIEKKLGPPEEIDEVAGFISTGILPLNHILSGSYTGGVPIGRITEIFGGESSGKTALATMVLAETQRMGGLAVFLDYEHAFDSRRAQVFGLDTEDKTKWIYRKPETAEAGFKAIGDIAEIVAAASEKGATVPITIVIDSVAAMVTLAELETDYSDLNMKTNLSLSMVLSRCLKRVAPVISKHNITLIFLNQTRDNPGVMYGEKEKTPGGKAMKFYASTRVKLSKTGKLLNEEKEVTGETVKATVIKNKVYRPFREGSYSSSFTIGVDLVETHVNFADELGILGNTKGWVEYNGSKMRRKELSEQMRQDKEKYDEFINFIINSGVEYE